MVVLSTEMTHELVLEGLAREVIHAVQNCRKEMGCEYTDRIEIVAMTPSADMYAAPSSFQDYLARETLAVKLDARWHPRMKARKAYRTAKRHSATRPPAQVALSWRSTATRCCL